MNRCVSSVNPTVAGEMLTAPNARVLRALQTGIDVEIPAGTQGIRDMMSQLTLRTGNEVGLFRMANGSRVLRMGGVDYVTLEGGVTRIIAHTHPSGRLALSSADIAALTRRGQFSSVIIDPRAGIGARLPVK